MTIETMAKREPEMAPASAVVDQKVVDVWVRAGWRALCRMVSVSALVGVVLAISGEDRACGVVVCVRCDPVRRGVRRAWGLGCWEWDGGRLVFVRDP